MRVALLFLFLVSGCTFPLLVQMAPRCITGLNPWKDVEIFEGEPPAAYVPIGTVEASTDHPAIEALWFPPSLVDALQLGAYARYHKRGARAAAIGNLEISDTYGRATVYALRE